MSVGKRKKIQGLAQQDGTAIIGHEIFSEGYRLDTDGGITVGNRRACT